MYNDSFRKRYKTAPVAITENTSHFDTAPHIHREVEILMIKDGNAEITVSDRNFKVSAGEIVIVNPLEVHAVLADRSAPYHQRCICFDLSLIVDKELRESLALGESTITEFHNKEYETTKELTDIFEMLFDAVSMNSEELFLESVAYVSLAFAKLKKLNMILTKKGKNKKSAFVSEVQAYLSEHFSEEITSSDISKELFYNQSYFCRLFRENFGVSFLEYLTLYRVSNAKILLSAGNLSISDVAERVGFLDASYFSRCFKKIVGYSPSYYRKRQTSGGKKSIQS